MSKGDDMNRKSTGILAGVVIAVMGTAIISESLAMETGRLNARQEKIIPIGAFTASGDLQKLETALSEGLDAGLTINEIKEVLVQLYAYAGFPRSLNAIGAFMSVLEAREQKGIRDEPGKEASPMPADKSSMELGTEIQTRLIGGPASGKYITFAPAIDLFLKGHLFGDIFGRDNLDFQSREIATISALANMDGLNPQLSSHLRVALNIGMTEAQIRSLIAVIESRVGKKQAENVSDVLDKVLSGTGKVSSNRQAEEAPQQIKIVRKGSQPSRNGQAEWFTGSVRIDTPFQAHDPAHFSGASVSFEPGARTAWHAHPMGQLLIVTSGTGRVQRWGDQAEEIREGDVVWIPPHQKHWHGAAPHTAMTHIAILEPLDGKSTEWMEKVSDEQYGN
jgi:4-carboxymuconolactone decarboxylase